MRYRLRTLLIVLALGPPLLAVAWRICKAPVAVPDEPEVIVRYFAGGDIRIVTRLEP